MKKKINDLKEHPLNIKIYGNENVDNDLVESIKNNGLLVPLTVKKDGTIISGHRRYKALKETDISDIPVNIIKFENEIEEKETLINFNKQRDKNYSQKYNEAKELEIIETEKAKLRQIEKLKKGNEQNSCSDTQTFAEREKGETKQIVAKKTGFGSKENLRKYEKIKAADKPEIIEKLDKGEITVNKAYQDIKKAERKKENEEKIKKSANKTIPSNIKLLEGDLFEQVKNIPDNSIDLLCTDPPYFVLDENWDTFKSYDDFLIFTEKWLNIVIPKIKNTGRLYISFPCDFKFDLYNILKKNNFYNFIFGNEIIWVKRNNNQMSNKKNYRYQYESILYLYGKNADKLNFTEYGEIQSNVWEIAIPQSNFKEGKFHPTQKPKELYRRIIKTGSIENDLILDCFAGSGTTGVICKELNKNCILIEKEKKYIDIIKGRINNVG